jgi:hypothetical protein
MLRIASLILGCVLILPLGGPTWVRAHDASPESTALVAASGEFAGLVDIGDGRRLWPECRGQGSPTVILIGLASGSVVLTQKSLVRR